MRSPGPGPLPALVPHKLTLLLPVHPQAGSRASAWLMARRAGCPRPTWRRSAASAPAFATSGRSSGSPVQPASWGSPPSDGLCGLGCPLANSSGWPLWLQPKLPLLASICGPGIKGTGSGPSESAPVLNSLQCPPWRAGTSSFSGMGAMTDVCWDLGRTRFLSWASTMLTVGPCGRAMAGGCPPLPPELLGARTCTSLESSSPALPCHVPCTRSILGCQDWHWPFPELA